MKKRGVLIVVLLSALLVIGGCAPKAASVSDSITGRQAEAVQPQKAAVPAAEEGSGATNYTYSSGSTEPVGDRMIISTVDMVLIVEDTDATVQELQNLVNTYKGFIENSRRWYSNDQPYATLTLRIPAQSLQEVLGIIRQQAIKVESENMTGEDVTEQYTDLASRLRNLEAAETELRALMTDVRENNGKAEDILAIYRELTTIRGQIEETKGRQQYLERMSALSTINIEIRPKAAPTTVIEKVSWNPLVTASHALKALVGVGKALADMAIWLAILSPIVLVPAAIIWLLVRLARRRPPRRPTPPKAEVQPK